MTLTIYTGRHAHSFPLPTGPAWTRGWSGTDNSLDVCLFSRKSGVFMEFEVSVGNTSIVPGDKTKSKATLEASFSVEHPRGTSIAWDCERAMPTTWFPMRETVRRFVVYPSDRALSAEAQTRAALVMDTSRWLIGQMQYGPCSMRMPALPDATRSVVHSNLSSWLAGMRQALAAGTSYHVEDSEDGPVLTGMGGWRTHGPKDRGAPAGSGIYHDTGWQDDPLMVPLFWLQAACAHERAWHVSRRDTGEAVSADDYPDGAIKYQAGTGDPNNGWLPELNGIAPWPDPLPLPYYSSHSIRGFRHVLALTEMTDSPMVKRMLASQAAQLRLQFGDKVHLPDAYYFPPSTRNYANLYRATPKQGGNIDMGRILGWPMFLWAQDAKINMNAGSAKACASAVDLCNVIAPRHGVMQRVMHNPGNDIWYDATWDMAHSFEVPIAYFGVAGSAIQAALPVPGGLASAATSLLKDVQKGPYYSGDQGPMDYLYVAHRGGAPVYPLASGKPGSDQVIGDPTHQENFASLAFNVTGDQKYIDYALGIGTVAPTRAAKRTNLEARTNLYGHAFLLALLQEYP